MTESSMPPLTRPYTPRIVDSDLDMLLEGIGAVALDGAKAVGKTASATRHAARTVRLDREQEASIVRADPDAAIREPFPVFFDEWQNVPAIWDAVRRSVDTDGTPGRVLLAGSAAPGARIRPTHTGAGRIVTVRMRPLAISERLAGVTPRGQVSVGAMLTAGERPQVSGDSLWTLVDYARAIMETGFPAIRTLSPQLRRAQLSGYVDHLTTRDVQEAGGHAANPAALRRWLQVYAAATSTTTSLAKLRDIATAGDGNPPAKTTTYRYRDALERTYIYDPVPAWKPGGTALSRLGEGPKIHLVDPGLSAHLLGVDEDALLSGASTPLVDAIPALRDGGLFGALFESLVSQSMRTYAQSLGVDHAYMRTREGRHEIDGLLIRRDQRCVAYEVKLAGEVDDRAVEHLHWLKERLGDQLLDAVVINTGPGAYRRPDGIAVVPAAMLIP